mgnify:CR=1 FL=1
MLWFHFILIPFTLLLLRYYIILYSYYYLCWPTALRLPVLFFSFFCQYACFSSKHPDSASGASNFAKSAIVPPQTDNRATTPSNQCCLSWWCHINRGCFAHIKRRHFWASYLRRFAGCSNQPQSCLAAAETPADLVEMPVVESGYYYHNTLFNDASPDNYKSWFPRGVFIKNTRRI